MPSGQLLDRIKISATAAAVIIATLGGAGYVLYKDLDASLSKKESTERVDKVISWDKEEFTAIRAERRESEDRMQAQLDKIGIKLDNFGNKLDEIRDRLPRKMASW